mgnify:CR=1 FL=1
MECSKCSTTYGLDVGVFKKFVLLAEYIEFYYLQNDNLGIPMDTPNPF